MKHLGTGIGWRPEIADAVERMPGIDWVEAVSENLCPGHLPDSLLRLRERGVTVVPHGVSLGLGGADRPDETRLAALAERVQALGSPLVTEHIAFVRGGGPLTASQPLEAGHLLPVPRTRDALDVLCENVRIAQDALPVPLAVENIAALISWPGEEMTEGQFLHELVERTGVRLLIDVANLHTNHVNRGEDPSKALDELPVEAIAYVHVAGGFERDGVWHDSHAHPVPESVLGILSDLAARVSPPGVLLERDENFPAPQELERELDAIRERVRTKAPVSGECATVTAPTAGEAAAELGGQLAGEPADGLGAGPAGELAGDLGAAPAAELAGDLGAAPAGDLTDGLGAAPAAELAGDLGAAPAAELTGDLGAAPAGDLTDGLGAAPAAELRGDLGAASAAEPSRDPAAATAVTRQRLALAQTALLSALVAGTPAPEGFDRARLAVQSRALTGKRADVVAKVAPELPEILGARYRAEFFAYAQARPMSGGYRRDALHFAERLLLAGRPEDAETRGRLTRWWLERSGPAPLDTRPVTRWLRAARFALRRG